MNAREQLHAYIQQLRRRLRLFAGLRGAAICAGSALVATLVLVPIANRLAFSSGSMAVSRGVLIVVVLVAAVLGLVWPLRRLDRGHSIRQAERLAPELEQRLTTFSEREAAQAGAAPDPFLELLAADTLELTPQAPAERFAPNHWVYGALGSAVACLAVLVWLIAAGPGYWGYGASLLWTGPRAHATPMYSLKVTPGNIVVRRHGDQLITAIPHGLAAPEVRIFARYQSATRWQAAPMRTAAGSGGYQYLFEGLPEDVDYYVEAGALRSSVYHIKVRDLPAVTGIAATYRYPAWTGLTTKTVAHAGDLRAVAGTRADLQLTTDQPLSGGVLELDNGQMVPLKPEGGNRYSATLTLQKDGLYHVAARLPGDDPTQPTRISEDYFIAAPAPAPPQVALVRPQRDYRASPIEEVTVEAKASDQYGLKAFDLHYSVNGGPDKTINLLQHPGAQQADGSTVLSLEDFHAQPGDLVSVYASAQDGDQTASDHGVARTDMLFIQADPFEREFSQSQQSGGGGGGGGGGQGNTAAQIVEREKEIISATFKQQHSPTQTTDQQKLASDTAKLLSQSQSTLRDQANSLSGRLQSRELSDQNQAFSDFQKDMAAAAAAMTPAASNLQGEKWSAAVPNEEQALRSLLRADATFRKIEIAFGARGGGGGGGGGAARDLASIFDLELDTEKNQYETQQTASSAQQRSQSIDDTLKKLDELAHRQQQLAQAHQNPAQSAQQRWQEDMLRREEQQLQKQLQSLMNAQNAQGAQQGQSAQSGQSGQRGQSGQGGQSGQQSASGSASSRNGAASGSSAQQQAAQAALNRLRQADDAMQRAAAQNRSPAQATADAQAAARALQQAEQALAGLQQQNASGRLASMAGEAGQLAQTQKQQAEEINKLAASKAQTTPEQIDQLVQGRQKVSDQFDHLVREMRNEAGDLNATQPAASSKLRDALNTADGDDLGTLLQRSSDWLRTGNFSSDTEKALTQGLTHMGQQIRDAQQALSSKATNPDNTQLAGAMSAIEQLRRQIADLGNPGAGNRGGNRSGQGPAGQQFQTGQLARNGQGGPQGQSGQRGQGTGQQGQGGQRGQGGRSAQGGGRNGQGGAQQAGNGGGAGPRNFGGAFGAGNVGNRIAGGVAGARAVNNSGGNRSAYGAYDTGNTHISGQAVAPQTGPNPADIERQIQQDLDAVNHIRPSLPQDAETQREIQAFINQMKNLDPSRFPGNPQAVEQLHQELLSSVDTLELQIRNKLDKSQGGQIRVSNPTPPPPGYEDAVAAYYRSLAGGK